MHRVARGTAAALALTLAVLTLSACSDTEPAPSERAPTHPMLVIGIDGAEWSVIERLWRRGEMPALAALAERGTRASLATDYGRSPVIWTTIATGRRPRVHGITDFVIPTARGDLPASSDHRRVPALWNMVSTAGRRVAVLGWWASWPAEEVDGVVVTDRALEERQRRVYPASLEAELDRLTAEMAGGGRDGGGGAGDGGLGDADWDLSVHGQRRDRVMEHFGRELAGGGLDLGGFDLMMVYFRSVDIESHNYWRYWQPERFDPPDPSLSAAELAARAERIPRVYRATDRAIGEIVAAAPADANVIVVSDHGFRAADEEQIQLLFNLDPVLERLGLLTRGGDGGVDLAASRLYTYQSAPHRREKLVRFGKSVPPRQRPAARARLERELGRVTWTGGEPVFRVREPDFRERHDGAELVVVVLRHGATPEVRLDGRPWADGGPGGRPTANPVLVLTRISGIHHRHTAGILIAAGPDVEPGARVSEISIHDLAPTILYGLGLPGGRDFSGRARSGLYREPFRRHRPPETIGTWGTREPDEAARSEADEKLLEELGALGYLD